MCGSITVIRSDKLVKMPELMSSPGMSNRSSNVSLITLFFKLLCDHSLQHCGLFRLMFVLVGTPLALVQLLFINSNCLVNVMCGNIVSFQREKHVV